MRTYFIFFFPSYIILTSISIEWKETTREEVGWWKFDGHKSKAQ